MPASPRNAPRVACEELIQSLRENVRRLEEEQRGGAYKAVGTGCAGLDRLLPAGGLVRGTLTEWLADCHGSGVGMLALSVAGEAMRAGGVLVVLDRSRQFFAPAAAWKLDLQKLIVLRPRSDTDALWAWDQALRCSAVAAVWGVVERLDWRNFRRLQLAAEEGGGIGLLLRPATMRGQPSWAELQLLVRPQPAEHWRWRVELTRCRGGANGSSVILELDEVTGALREIQPAHSPLANQLAHPSLPPRAAREHRA